VICQHDNLVAINSAIEIDLTGQAVADSIGEQLYSGMGGHATSCVVRPWPRRQADPGPAQHGADTDGPAAHRALRAAGAGVLTTRGDIHYVVTEYGVAYLHGKNMRERAMSLISIAHPISVRAVTRGQASPLGVRDNPPHAKPYPAELEQKLTLADGRELVVRPSAGRRAPDQGHVLLVQRTDQVPAVPWKLKSLPHNRLQVFCNVDYDAEMALVVAHGEAVTRRSSVSAAT